MKLLLLCVGLIIALAQADEETWKNFQVKHHKIYKNQTEEQLRQKVFNDNLQKIEKHNKNYELGLVSYKLGVNAFADLTQEEFAARFKTIAADKIALQSGQLEYYDATKDATKALPTSIDWRTRSVVTDVANQGLCGGCWSFSAAGTIEGQLALQTGELKTLSKQQFLDCDTEKNMGCSGGVVQYAIDYVTKNGLTSEENYPYKAVQQTCSTSMKKNIVVRTKGYVNIKQNNETDLKQAVGLIGPISVAINAIPIQLYESGIFNDTCSDDLDHAVLAVGYGLHENTTEYWIIKNSWGSEWGEEGFFRMALGSNLCGIARQACYPVLATNSGYSLMESSLKGILTFLLSMFMLYAVR